MGWKPLNATGYDPGDCFAVSHTSLEYIVLKSGYGREWSIAAKVRHVNLMPGGIFLKKSVCGLVGWFTFCSKLKAKRYFTIVLLQLAGPGTREFQNIPNLETSTG